MKVYKFKYSNKEMVGSIGYIECTAPLGGEDREYYYECTDQELRWAIVQGKVRQNRVRSPADDAWQTIGEVIEYCYIPEGIK